MNISKGSKKKKKKNQGLEFIFKGRKTFAVKYPKLPIPKMDNERGELLAANFTVAMRVGRQYFGNIAPRFLNRHKCV